MRLVDADKLVSEGWVLKKYRPDGSELDMKSIADVPTAYDVDNILEENSMLRAKINYMRLRGEVAND